MPKWFWKILWISQVINWIVTIWAYGTPDGSCLLAPLFTIAWVLKDEIRDCFRVIFEDDWEFEEGEDFRSKLSKSTGGRLTTTHHLKKGA